VAARTSAVLTYKAECKIKYKYKCEHCGILTDEFEFMLQQFANHKHNKGSRFAVNLELDLEGIAETEDKARKRLRRLRSMLKKTHDSEKRDTVITEKPQITEYYNEVFAEGDSCPGCKTRQSWFPLSKSPRLSDPIITWGKSKVDVVGLPADSEGTHPNNVKSPGRDAYAVNTRVINKRGIEKEDLIHWQMRGIEHDNIVGIWGVTEHTLGIYTIAEDSFDGIPLSMKIYEKLPEGIFQDYIMQLMDALEFLHQQTPPIIHNAVLPENILIGKGNLLKLANIDNATHTGSPATDISMIGDVMKGIRGKYIARYKDIIQKCDDRKYQSIEDIRKDMAPLLRPRRALLTSVVAVIIIAMAIILRRFL